MTPEDHIKHLRLFNQHKAADAMESLSSENSAIRKAAAWAVKKFGTDDAWFAIKELETALDLVSTQDAFDKSRKQYKGALRELADSDDSQQCQHWETRMDQGMTYCIECGVEIL